MALVHGTSAVEWPFRDHHATLSGLAGLLAATAETSAFLRANAPSLSVEDIGNLFRGELFWGNRLDEIIHDYRTSGPVVFLGTLTPNKTRPLSALFTAVASLDRQLIVVGGGPHAASLQRAVEEQGLDSHISFVGAVTDPRPWLAQASLVVTAGRGAIESMAAGRPTLIATSDGVHGIAYLNDLAQLETFNFTGRTPSSEAPETERMIRELTDGFSMHSDERVQIAARVRSIGSTTPIISAINES
jgi:glycosyltransferase involved in cell wall biosynthesis